MHGLDLPQQIKLKVERLRLVRILQPDNDSSQHVLVELLEDLDTRFFWVCKTEYFPEPLYATRHDSIINSSSINHLRSIDSKILTSPVTGEIIITNRIWERAKVLGINPYNERIIPALFYRVRLGGDDRYKVISYAPYVDQKTLFERLIEWNAISTECLIKIFKDLAGRLDVLVNIFHVVPKDLHWKNILVNEDLETFIIDFGSYYLLEELEFQSDLVKAFFDFITNIVEGMRRVYSKRDEVAEYQYGHGIEKVEVLDEEKARIACNKTWSDFRDLAMREIDFEHPENNLTFSQLMDSWISHLLESDQANES